MDYLFVLDGGRVDGEVDGEEGLDHAQAGHGGQPMLSQRRYPDQGVRATLGDCKLNLVATINGRRGRGCLRALYFSCGYKNTKGIKLHPPQIF